MPILIWALVGSCIQTALSARILAVDTVEGKSHRNFMSGILRALVNSGHHNVNVFTQFTDGNRENYTKVDTTLEGVMQFMDIDLKHMMSRRLTIICEFVMMSRIQCDQVYENSKKKEVLESARTEFDLVIVEYLEPDYVSYIATKLNLPLIYATPIASQCLNRSHNHRSRLKSVNYHGNVFLCIRFLKLSFID